MAGKNKENGNTHSRLAPSSALRWMTCPGSIRLIEKLDIEEKSNKYAAEGTAAHELHSLCLLNNQKAERYKGRTFESDGLEFKVDDDMIDAVQTSLNYIADTLISANFKKLKTELQVEVRSSLKYLAIPGLDGGTSDVVILLRDKKGNLVGIEVLDYKHGAGVTVEVKNNPQAMCYALGVIEKYKAGPETPVKITIVQPRLRHPDGPIHFCTTTAQELRSWGDEKLIPAAKATMEDDAPLIPSEGGCRFCKAAGDCPALYKRTQAVAMTDFEDSDPKAPDVKELSADRKRFILDNAAMLRSFIVAVENQVKTEVEKGSREYEGYYKLVRKKTNRRFTEEAVDELMTPLLDYLKREEVFEEKIRPLTQIEKLLKKRIGVKEAKSVMSAVTSKPEGALEIAPVTDKRPAVQPSVVTDFKEEKRVRFCRKVKSDPIIRSIRPYTPPSGQ